MKQPEDLHQELIWPQTFPISLITDPTDNYSSFKTALTRGFLQSGKGFVHAAQISLALGFYPCIPPPLCIKKVTSKCLKSSFFTQNPLLLLTCLHWQQKSDYFKILFSSIHWLGCIDPRLTFCHCHLKCDSNPRELGEIFSRPHWPQKWGQCKKRRTQYRAVLSVVCFHRPSPVFWLTWTKYSPGNSCYYKVL